MTREDWHKLMISLGSYRDQVNACYIPTCDGVAEVKVHSHVDTTAHFYCRRCADDLVKTGLFVATR